MSAAPVTETATRRRIGDILLEHGFASEAELTEAAAEQERTGQPLGQILVQQGVITRLELASALAEQWSDQSLSISLLPVPKPAPKPVAPHNDDDQYAARLQDAVADLARRVHATQPSDGADERFTDLAERIEATVARTQRIEATLATFADSLEGVTGGVEDAFAGLQGSIASIALDLARIDTTVAEIMAQPLEPTAADPALSARLEELGAAVQSLAARPVADDGLRGNVDEIAARLEQLADGAALDHLGEALADVQARVESLAGESATSLELERQAAVLADLRAAVATLESRPVGSPEIDARLERIEAGLADRSATDEAAAAVDVLAARVAAESGAIAELRAALEARPEPASARKLEKLGDALDRLRGEVASLGKATTGAQLEEVAARVEQLAADRDAIAPLTARLDVLETTLSAEVVTNDGLARALSRTHDELSRAIPKPDGRIDRLAEQIDSLRNEVGRIAEAPIARIEDLAGDLASLRDEIAAGTPEPDGRIDRLAHELQELRNDLARAQLTEGATGADPRVEHLAHELQSLRSDLSRVRDQLGTTTTEPDSRIDHLAYELQSLRSELATAAPEPDGRIDQLAHDLVSVQAELARTRDELAGTAPDPELAARLETLSGRVAELDADRDRHAELAAHLQAVERRLASDLVSSTDFEEALGGMRAALEHHAATPQGSPETEQAVLRLEARLGALEALSARVDGLTEAVAAAAPAEPATAGAELRRELELRIDDLARMLDDRLAAAGTVPPTSAGAAPELEDELERTRMAIERVGLHLGEHDRALSELRGSRAVTARLDELAARVDELAEAGHSASPAPQGTGERSYVRRSLEPDPELRSLIRRLEDVEEAAHAGREKLMSRLERMASSIDWRLQRLEAGEATEAE